MKAICGSDLHLYDGVIPAMQQGDILGHEFMGEVVELGSALGDGDGALKIGERVVVMPLDDAPRGYDIFMKKQEQCVKVVLHPGR